VEFIDENGEKLLDFFEVEVETCNVNFD